MFSLDAKNRPFHWVIIYLMLDIKFVRDNADKVRQACQYKKIDPTIVNAVLEADQKRRSFISEVELLRSKRNALNELLKKGRTEELLKQASALKEESSVLEPKVKEAEEVYAKIILELPNVPLDDIPVGKDESENVVIKTVGEPTKFDFVPKDHMELGQALDIIDTDTAAKVAGSRFGYLKGEAALIEMALVNFVFKTLTNKEVLQTIADKVKPGYNPKPFAPVIPPVMIKPDVYRRMARLTDADKDERYYLQQDDMYLIGSAEHTLGPIHMDQTLPEKDFPIRYIGFSTSFRREAGSYGKDTKGIIRVHQFDKLEIESFTLPEDSRIEQDFIVAIQEYLVNSLKIPYQLISICTGDMGKPDARQMDINCWMPGENQYRETHTSDLMTDFQSRRLETKVQRTNGETQYVHMNDATAFAIGRILVAIIENYQQIDGSIKIPEILVPFVGKEIISRA